MKKIVGVENWFLFIVNIGTFCALLFLACKNYNEPEFLKVNAYELLTLLCFVVFTYSFTKYQKKQQGMKSNVERLLRCIVEELQCIDEESLTSAKGNMVYRTIKNYLETLGQVSKQLGFDEELKYIRKEFDGYKEFWGNHIGDDEYIKKSKNEFEKYKRNIKAKIEDIVMRFYIS